MQPIKISKILKPQKIYSSKPGIYIYDFGQNFTGFIRLNVRGPRGCQIILRFSELVYEDGTINTATNGNAKATDTCFLKGEGEEIFEPHFTYHGFRYVEITGFPGVPTIDNVEGLFFHTAIKKVGDFSCSNDLFNQIHTNIIWGQLSNLMSIPTDCPQKKVGDFSCSNDLFNQIHTNIIWGQLSNLMSIPTDCPQRDERNGWMGDAQLTVEEAIFNFDMARFYSKYVRDILLCQKEDGSLSDVVPPYWKFYPADPVWGTAYITIAWYIYNIVPRKTPVELTSSWYYYHDVHLLTKIAQILGHQEDQECFSNKANAIKEAFNAKFLKGVYDIKKLSPVDRTISQTSNILPLYLDMVPENKKNQVLSTLVKSIKEEFSYHFDTGIVGTRYIFDVLTENGYPEVIFKMVKVSLDMDI
jgi:alpha-L-rhamnosidase